MKLDRKTKWLVIMAAAIEAVVITAIILSHIKS